MGLSKKEREKRGNQRKKEGTKISKLEKEGKKKGGKKSS